MKWLVLFVAISFIGCQTPKGRLLPAPDALEKALKLFPEDVYGPVEAYAVTIKRHHEEGLGNCWLFLFKKEEESAVGDYAIILVSMENDRFRIMRGR